MLKYENVTFIKEEVKKMSKSAFIAQHLNVFWLDRDEAKRKKMLGAAYDLITGVKKGKK